MKQHGAEPWGWRGCAGWVWLLRKPVFSKLGTARHVPLCWGMQEEPRARDIMSPACRGVSHELQPQRDQEAPVTVPFQCWSWSHQRTHVLSHTHVLPHTQRHKSHSLSLRVRRRSVFASLGTAKDASAYLTGSLLFLFHFLSSP